MATAKRQPEIIIPTENDGAGTIADGAVVVTGSADNKVALPAGADPVRGVRGIAVLGSTAAKPNQDIATAGVYPGIVAAGGTATRGKYARVANASGHCTDADAAAGGGVAAATQSMVVGQWTESGTPGQRAGIQIDPETIYRS